MEPLYLILAFFVFFVITLIYIIKRDILYGGVYFFLYLYTVFVQIGYSYFPQLSIMTRAYFGVEYFYKYFYFVLLSFISFFIIFLSTKKFIFPGKYKVIVIENQLNRCAFYIGITIHLVLLLVMFYRDYDLINYGSILEPQYQLFVTGYKFLTIMILVLYGVYKTQKKVIFRWINRFYLMSSLILFIMIAIKSGNRTDIVALFLGISLYELYPFCDIKKKAKNILFLAVATIVITNTLLFIEHTRTNEDKSDLSSTERFLLKDYYAPSHILIAAMYLEYVKPKEVFLSNLANTFVKLNYPYLQTEIGNILSPGSSSRNTGYAFYVLTEGFMVLGWLGFIYNGIILNLGVYLWRWMSLSDNVNYNTFILALSSTQLANIARSQSMYFVKDIYMMFLPAMFLYFLGTGLRPFVNVNFFSYHYFKKQ